MVMTRKDFNKLLDYAGLEDEDDLSVFLAKDVENLGELEPGDFLRLEPNIISIASDMFAIRVRPK
jgi:hypothetical protein